MMRNSILLFIFLLITLSLAGALPPKREFRGVWIATVNQLDWPSVPGAPANEQQQELLKMLDKLEQLNFNAVIFQVRPSADAFYRSETEPWSHWLSGEQGKAPDQGWDPLEFIIKECHLRGMELHAWLNPFRVSQSNSMVLSPSNIANRYPEWVIQYDNKKFLDPGIPQVRQYLTSVVSEIVSRYDVDAIHMDDYFYPYPSVNATFPDTASFRQYNRGFSTGKIEDWRRENVDSIIHSLSLTIKKIKPMVKFGISPFGVWRNSDIDPKGSATKAAITNYDHLYADVIKWQKNGWTDYLIPQLYWEFNHPAADFKILSHWWEKHSYNRHIYIGHAAYKALEAAGTAWNNPDELPRQIKESRAQRSVQGSVFFRMQHIERNANGISDSLANNYYRTRALLPNMSWLDRRIPNAPGRLRFVRGAIRWDYSKKIPASDDLLGHLIYYSKNKKSFNRNNPNFLVGFTPGNSCELNQLNLETGETLYLWVVALDKRHNESKPVGPVRIK
jgi:uncharacterized lipoprotein YddW (UPF0748 family)